MMFGALLKKQILETFSGFFQNRKTGKSRKGIGLVGFIALYAFLFFMLGFSFYHLCASVCVQLSDAGITWLYFALIGLVSVMFGLIGSVLSTYQSIYKATDNEFLLSLPIPPRYILAIRLFGVEMWSLIFVGVVFIPGIIAYCLNCNSSFVAVIFDVILLLVLSIFVLTLSCILGWVVAKVTGKVKKKNLVTMITSLLFMVFYYIGYTKANTALQNILTNADGVGEKIKGVAYPLYIMGRMGEGDFLSAILFTLIVAVLFAVVYAVLSKTFIKLSTMSEYSGRKIYKEKSRKGKSPRIALLQKEFRRFLGSPVYMLNCSLGTILLPFLGILSLVQSDFLQSIISNLGEYSSYTPIVVCAAIGAISFMNDITTPSISLEGKNLWILKSLPVSAWQVLKSKLMLHLLLTEIPVLFCAICFAISFHLDIFQAIFVILIPMIFVLFSASFGLIINLKSPNFIWTNETALVKQSLSVLLAMFGGWIFVFVVTAISILIAYFLNVEISLLLTSVFVLGLASLMLLWLKTKGSRIFERL